jgi:hypothetical protein
MKDGESCPFFFEGVLSLKFNYFADPPDNDKLLKTFKTFFDDHTIVFCNFDMIVKK